MQHYVKALRSLLFRGMKAATPQVHKIYKYIAQENVEFVNAIA